MEVFGFLQLVSCRLGLLGNKWAGRVGMRSNGDVLLFVFSVCLRHVMLVGAKRTETNCNNDTNPPRLERRRETQRRTLAGETLDPPATTTPRTYGTNRSQAHPLVIGSFYQYQRRRRGRSRSKQAQEQHGPSEERQQGSTGLHL